MECNLHRILKLKHLLMSHESPILMSQLVAQKSPLEMCDVEMKNRAKTPHSLKMCSDRTNFLNRMHLTSKISRSIC